MTDCAWNEEPKKEVVCEVNKSNPAECPLYKYCKLCKYDYDLQDCGTEDGDTIFTTWRLP